MGYALDKGWSNDLLILSDNQAVVKDVKDNALSYSKHETTYVIKERNSRYLETAKRKENREVRVVLGWIPAYRGIRGNEDVDGIAKEATTEAKDKRIKVPAKDWYSQRRNVAENKRG